MDAEKLAMQRRIDTLDQHATSLHAALTEYERENARLKAELETVKRERDALMHDLRIVGNSSFSVCVVCKHGDPCAVACQRADVDCLEWRGPCAENGGVDE